ncbi:cupin domain-containing protein [Arcobacter cloacae]|uniref:Cupin n=1 Tax=Arcobacter cloacae TaxID=1054034 RepID=A0A4Q0ZBX8_9BACT|nr:cupin domain-containing protein [Arcobacter cloacae]RXJ83382.1 cupin [Arcobacter cloacae]
MNDNYEKRVLINTNDLKWIEDEVKGVSKKLLSKINNQETAIIKIEENYKLNTNSKINSVEILVLEGTYINEYGEFKSGTYLRLSKEDELFVESGKMGCIVFRKINHFTDETQNIVIDTINTLWLQGQGNLEVMPLFEQTALVKWPKNEKFISHKHWGGEEIYVLNGTFMDEYGKYPKGTWIRSPHLSQHFPYVEDETIIFVKTGHL